MFMIYLLLVVTTGSLLAASPPQSYITIDDLQIVGMPALDLGHEITLSDAISVFGQTLNYNESRVAEGVLWHAVFQTVELWAVGSDTAALERVVITKPGYTTIRGITIGDTKSSVFTAYGTPGFTSDSNGLTWHRYFVQNSLKRILFGINSDGIVEKIGYAHSAGGL